MHRSLIFILSAALMGCVTRTMTLFVPPGVNIQRSSCGVPYVSKTFQLADGVSSSLSLSSEANTLNVSLTFSLDEGHSVRLASPNVLVVGAALAQPVRGTLGNFRIVVYGKSKSDKGHVEQFEAIEELHGLSRNRQIAVEYAKLDTFESIASVPYAPSQLVSVQLPSLFVDGKEVTPPLIRFEPRQQSYALTCVQ